MKHCTILFMVGLVTVSAVSAQESAPEVEQILKRIPPLDIPDRGPESPPEAFRVPSIQNVKFGAESLRAAAAGAGTQKELRRREREALELTEDWKEGDATTMTSGGRVVYVYNETIHSVVCATLRICDIQLQSGEQVTSVNVGDNVRWTVTPALSGPEGRQTTHLLVKPEYPELETTMVVTTDRRVYHFSLKSTTDEFIPVIGFKYPNEGEERWGTLYAANTEAVENPVNDADSSPLSNIENLDFNYTINGDRPLWTPVRVFNDGTRTIIQMPQAMSQSEAPAFMVNDSEGETQIVNYRVRDDRYIVDLVFDRGVLVSGVGRNQERVVIERASP